MKVGICSMKAFRDGRVMIETRNQNEIELVNTAINEKCSQQLESNIPQLRNPNLIIRNIPENITLENAEEVITTQNPELNMNLGDIKTKFIYTTKRKIRNLVIEVGSKTRKKLLETRLKVGWLICYAEDYLIVTRCFKCSRFGHRASVCKGELTCPRCTGNHSLKDCPVEDASEFKCINCVNYNRYCKNQSVCVNHSSMDTSCTSYIAVTEKYKQNIDY